MRPHCVLLAASLTLAFLTSATAEDYRLASQDKVRVKVVEWRAGKAEYKEWESLTEEYVVGAAGALSIPLIGEIQVNGKTTAEVAAAISDALKGQMGLMTRPITSVEVAQFRPFYLSGEVERPGEYPFRPNLNVMQAVSLAGGIRRETESGLMRLERDRISAAGLAESARLELKRLLVRRARLRAEFAKADSFEAPGEIAPGPELDKMMRDERAYMKSRSDALQSQLSALKDLRLLYAKEVDSLARKSVSQQKQIGLGKQELSNVSSLVGKGLAVTSRENSLERMIADLESKLLDYETASLEAQQEINKAQRDASDLETKRRSEIISDLQDTELAVEQSTSKLNTSLALIDEATITAPKLVLERSLNARRVPRYSIVRADGKGASESPADETTPVLPGDTVRVLVESPEDDGTGRSPSSAALNTQSFRDIALGNAQ